MKLNRWIGGCVGALCLGLMASAAHAQIEEDWAVFSDDQTDAQCDLVIGSNQEFVVLFESGNLATATGVILTDLVVDLANPALPVTFAGEPFGFLDFRTDADGLPTLFWLSLTDTVVGINSFTSEPFDSGQLPSQIGDTLCDACEVIQSSLCDDGGNGGDPIDPIDIINLCGAGLGDALAMAAISIPVLGLVSRRRRTRVLDELVE